MSAAPAAIVLPTPYPVGPVNCWLLRGDPLTLVDAGPRTPAALDALELGLAREGLRLEEIELLVLTHQHADHIGLAGTVHDRSACLVAAYELLVPYLADIEAAHDAEEAYQDEVMRLHGTPPERREALIAILRARRAFTGSVHVDRGLREGDVLEAGGRRFAVSLRPGHSPSDTVFVDETGRTALAGDHLLGHISSNPLAHRPLDGPADPRRRRSSLAAYLDSLARTAGEDLGVLYTGHGRTIDDHRALVAERTDFQHRRKLQVLAELRDGPARADELSRALWPDVPPNQTYLTLSEVLGALDLLELEGRVRALEDEDGFRYERVSR